jgi:peptidoglycan/xylan/chitin deacetylase (PgdA/CDA1 family)
MITVKEFEKQLDALASSYSIISMAEALQKIKNQSLFKNHAVLTFDDGYCDSYEIIFPILKKKGIRALFSVVTNYIGIGRPLWDWEFLSSLEKRGDCPESVNIGGKRLKRRFFENKLAFGRRVLEQMKRARTSDIEFVLRQLKNGASSTIGGTSHPADRCLEWDELKTMSLNGMEIASHSLSHRSLSRLSPEEAIHEIGESKRVLEKNMGTTCNYFSFPFGSSKDISDCLMKHIEEAGYLCGLLNIDGINDMTTDPFRFKRIIMS